MPRRLGDLPQRAGRGHGIAALQPRDGRLRRVHTLSELRLRKVREGARLDQGVDEGVLFLRDRHRHCDKRDRWHSPSREYRSP